MGKDGFSWFVGVVEDRNDPAQLGRVRVRVLGRHSEDLTKVKTTDLPWAHVMHPVTDPSMQGLGHTPSFLTQGSWVVGFFRDTEAQQPVIMGTLPGIPEESAIAHLKDLMIQEEKVHPKKDFSLNQNMVHIPAL